MENKITTPTITFPDVEKRLVTLRAELLETAKRDGRYYGIKNRPAKDEPTCQPYYSPIKTGAEQGRADVLGILQPSVHVNALQSIDEKLKLQEVDANQRIEELQHLNDVERRELEGKNRPQKPKPNILGWILTAAVNICDVVFNARAFEALGDSLLYSLGMGLGVAAAAYALSKGVIRFLERAKTEGRKFYYAAAGVFLAAAGGFWVLSEFRAHMMAEEGIDSSFSPTAFLFLNLFFFVASIVIGAVFFPPKNQVESDCELAERFEKIEAREKEIQGIKDNLSLARDTADKERKEHEGVLNYTRHVLDRISAIFLEAVATFKSHDMLSRPDRSVPDSFTEAVPDLDGMQFDVQTRNLQST